MSLAQKQCVPCKGGIPPLTREEAEKFLEEVPQWQVADDNSRISRTFKFKNFVAAQSFVNQVADLAEAEGHHPDITFGWGYATVVFYTHKIKGLHENDFVMAAKVDALAV
jgi:4a-hydroxytetrahydrobiopterin dehydratase